MPIAQSTYRGCLLGLAVGDAMGFTVDDRKLKRAGLDYWHLLDITYYQSLDEFFAKNNGPFYYFSTKAPQNYTDVTYRTAPILFLAGKTRACRKAFCTKTPRPACGCP